DEPHLAIDPVRSRSSAHNSSPPQESGSGSLLGVAECLVQIFRAIRFARESRQPDRIGSCFQKRINASRRFVCAGANQSAISSSFSIRAVWARSSQLGWLRTSWSVGLWLFGPMSDSLPLLASH